jgi:hypothetical protein
MSQRIDCPICHAVNTLDDSTVGCYVACQNCQTRFYVTVPPPGEERAMIRSEPTVATYSDATSAGGKNSQTLARQESLLWTISQEVAVLRRMLIAFGVVMTLCLVALAAALWMLVTGR